MKYPVDQSVQKTVVLEQDRCQFLTTAAMGIASAGAASAAPRSWGERVYPKLIYYNKLDKDGHFAAWEQLKLFCAEMRAAFHSLRQSI